MNREHPLSCILACGEESFRALPVKFCAYSPSNFSMIYRLCETHFANLSLTSFAKKMQTAARAMNVWILKKRIFLRNGALERTRTFTPLGAQPPRGCVSTNSTTSAPDW